MTCAVVAADGEKGLHSSNAGRGHGLYGWWWWWGLHCFHDRGPREPMQSLWYAALGSSEVGQPCSSLCDCRKALCWVHFSQRTTTTYPWCADFPFHPNEAWIQIAWCFKQLFHNLLFQDNIDILIFAITHSFFNVCYHLSFVQETDAILQYICICISTDTHMNVYIHVCISITAIHFAVPWKQKHWENTTVYFSLSTENKHCLQCQSNTCHAQDPTHSNTHHKETAKRGDTGKSAKWQSKETNTKCYQKRPCIAQWLRCWNYF